MFFLFDCTDANGKNDIKEWALGLEKRERAKLNAKLDILAKPGSDLFPQVLTGAPTPGILKLRAKGKVQLRPMLCKGSIDEKEFTLLIGAKERGSQFVPEKADEKANVRKQIIIENPSRRCSHERIS